MIEKLKTHVHHGLFYFIGALLAVSVLTGFGWEISAQKLLSAAVAAVFMLIMLTRDVRVSWRTEGVGFLLLSCCFISAIGAVSVPAVRSSMLVLLDAAALGYLAGFLAPVDRKKVMSTVVMIGMAVTVLMGAYSVRPGIFLPLVVNPNICAGYLLLAYLLAVTRASDRSYRIAAIVLLAGLFLTKSRAAVMLAFACTLFYWWRPMKSSVRIGAVTVFVAATAMAIMSVGDDSSLLNRIAWWQSAWHMAVSNPLTGIGWGNFGNMYLAFRTTLTENTLYAHNFLLQVFAEAGLIGLTACTVFFMGRLRTISLLSPQGLAVSGFLLYNLFDYSFYIPSLLFTVFIILFSAESADGHCPGEKKLSLNRYAKAGVGVVFAACSLFLMMNSGARAYDSSSQAETDFKNYTATKNPLFLARSIDQQMQAVQFSPQTAALRSDLAWLYWVAGLQEPAKKEIMEAVRRDPLNNEYQKTLRHFVGKK